MSFIQLIADSACDLPLSYFEEQAISFIPLRVNLDNKDYDDLTQISPIEVYQAMRAGKTPITSQASPQYFTELFTKMATQEKSGVYIAFSSELSGTYSTAVMIRDQIKEEYPSFDLDIIDSKCASLGYGLVVMEASKLLKSGLSKTELVIQINELCEQMEHLFTVDDLQYLARGGRISKTSAFVGGLLNIKPLLNVEDGKLIPLEKIRGRKKLFRRIIELMKERGINLNNQLVGISHADDEEAAIELKKMIEQEFGTKEFFINSIGATIGSHVGPGTLAVFFLNKK